MASRFCSSCGVQLSGEVSFCSNCRAPVVRPSPVTSASGQAAAPALAPEAPTSSKALKPNTLADLWRNSKAVRISVIVLGLFLAIGLIAQSVFPSGDKGMSTVKTAAPTETKPPLDDATVYPYALLKNPYAHKNHRVVAPTSWPVIFNGQVMDDREAHNEGMIQLGYTGLCFERMLSDGTALYNVMGTSAQSTSTELELLGQLAVQAPSTAQLETQKFWDVEPLGAVEGTNAFGGQVTVPVVKFWTIQKPALLRCRSPRPLPETARQRRI